MKKLSRDDLMEALETMALCDYVQMFDKGKQAYTQIKEIIEDWFTYHREMESQKLWNKATQQPKQVSRKDIYDINERLRHYPSRKKQEEYLIKEFKELGIEMVE